MTIALEATASADAVTERTGHADRGARAVILFASLACAACGLVYELALIALGGYLIGNTIHQTSVVLALFIFAMGLGALAAKRLAKWPVLSFAAVEGVLGLLGGLSVLVLYASFAWLGLYQPIVIALSLALGALIGAEIPVLVAMLQRVARRDSASEVADLFAADYLGALVGGLAFPFVLLPVFGLLRGALLTGVANIACAGLVLFASRRTLPRRTFYGAGSALAAVVAVLAVTATMTEDFEVSARQALYDDPIVHAERSAYQDVVLTRSLGRKDLRLFLNGDLQFASTDEYRYHEALVHPAMNGPRSRVLVLGGGDGLALREVLRYDDVHEVVLVELDPAVIRLARSDARLRDLNESAFADTRVRVVTADAFAWLRTQQEDPFDVVVADFPDPDDIATAKLYSQEIYGLLRATTADDARLVVQAGSPHFAREAYWCIERSVAAAGWSTKPYHLDVPSFGDWGFVLASRAEPPLALATEAPALRSLDQPSLAAAAHFSPDRGPVPVKPSTLLAPVILEYERGAWRDY